MDNDKLIKVPTEFARTLNRMGLPEYELVQVDADGAGLSMPAEFGRTLLRMGGEFKEFTDSDFIFSKATKCEFAEISDNLMANIGYVKNLSQSGNGCNLNIEYNQLVDIASPVTSSTKKYIVLLIKTNFETIVGVKFNNTVLTETDVTNAAKLGGGAGTIAWWVDTDTIKGETISAVIENVEHSTETITVTAKDVSKYDLTYTNVDGQITAVFKGTEDRIITPGTGVVSVGETVTVNLTAASGKLIDTVTVGSQTVTVGAETFEAEVSEDTESDITVVAVAKDA